MKLLFLAIQQYLIASLTAYNVSYVRMLNDQLERIKSGEINDLALLTESGERIAILVEFVSPATIEQLGNGAQLYNPLDINLHFLHQFYDAQDGTQDQDLKVLSIAEDVFDAFQEWMPSDVSVGVMTRNGESWDYNHDGIYHFVQPYRTTFVDTRKLRPENGELSDPTATLQLVRINSLQSSTQYYYN